MYFKVSERGPEPPVALIWQVSRDREAGLEPADCLQRPSMVAVVKKGLLWCRRMRRPLGQLA